MVLWLGYHRKNYTKTPYQALTPATTSLPLESPGPTLYSGLIAQSRFHLLTNSVYQRLISSPSITPEETLNLQKPMDDWYNGLPSYITTHYNLYLLTRHSQTQTLLPLSATAFFGETGT
jgi:hypothetical protein